MAVTLDAAGSMQSNGTTTTTSFNYSGITVGSGPNRALFAFVYHGAGANPSAITATWDSGGTNQAMTLIGQAPATGARIRMYALLNPTPGNKTLAVAWTTVDTIAVCAVSFYGVLQTSIARAFVHTPATATYASTTTPTLTLDAYNAGKNMMVGTVVANQTISGTPGTTIFNGLLHGTGSELGSASYICNTGITGTFNWTLAVATTGSFNGVELVAAPELGDVTIDAQSTNNNSTGAGSPITHTSMTVGTGTSLLAFVSWNANNTTTAPTGRQVNWDSTGTNQLMTELVTVDDTTNNLCFLAIYGLLNPTPGNKTLRIAWSGGMANWTGCAPFCVSMNGAGSFSAGSVASPQSSLTAQLTNLASVKKGDLAFMLASQNGGNGWAGTQTGTQLYSVALTSNFRADFKDGYTSNVTLQAPQSGTGNWAAVGVVALASGIIPLAAFPVSRRPGLGPIGFRPRMFPYDLPIAVTVPPVTPTGSTLPLMGVG